MIRHCKILLGVVGIVISLYVGIGCIVYASGMIYPYSHDDLTMLLECIFGPFDWLYRTTRDLGFVSPIWLPAGAITLFIVCVAYGVRVKGKSKEPELHPSQNESGRGQ